MSEEAQVAGGEPVAGIDELERLEAQAAHEEAQAAEAEYIPGVDPEPAPPQPSTAEVVTPLVGLLFSVVAARRGEHWELKRAEGEALGGELGAVLDHYMPDQEMPPWVGLAVAGVAIIGPRIAADKALAVAQEKAAAAARAAAEGTSDAG